MLLEAKLKNNNFKIFKLNKEYTKEDLLNFINFLKEIENLAIPIFNTIYGDHIIVKGDYCSCRDYEIILDDDYGMYDKYFIILDIGLGKQFLYYNEVEFNKYFEQVKIL